MTKEQIQNELQNYTYSESFLYYKNKLWLSDGVRFLCRVSKFFWLLDIIYSNQQKKKFRQISLQIYNLKVREDRTAVLTVLDKDRNVLHSQVEHDIDFPLDEVEVFYENQNVLLPAEY